MRVTLQLVICHDDGHEETVTDVITLNKNNQRIERLGLSLAESKQLLSTLQRHLLHQQVTTFLGTHPACPDCGTLLHLKARGNRSFRTLFGTFTFSSPPATSVHPASATPGLPGVPTCRQDRAGARARVGPPSR